MKFDTSDIPENQNIDKKSELLQYLNTASKDKTEVRNMNYKMMRTSIITSGAAIIPALVIYGVFSKMGVDMSPMITVMSIAFAGIGVGFIGMIGLSRGA